MLKHCMTCRYKNKLKKFETYNINSILNNNENGFLKIIVYQNETDKPIENAEVRVSLLTITGEYHERGIGRLIASVRTDEDGSSPIIELPAKNRLQKSADEAENSIYILAVHADGFYSAYAFDLQIYPGITTSYRIYLQYRHEDPTGSYYEFILEPIIQCL